MSEVPEMPSLEQYMEEQMEAPERYELAYIDRAEVSKKQGDINGWAVYAQRAAQMHNERRLLIRILAGEGL